MNQYRCVSCEKYPLTRNEVGINKKLLDTKSKDFYCLDCLAFYLEVEVQDILDKIKEFKEEGCKLFD